MSGTSRTDQARAALDALAQHAGLQREWQDAQGVSHRVSDDTISSLLERLGLPCRTLTQMRQSSAALAAEHHGRRLPALLSAECERAIALPSSALRAGSRYRIELESGALIDGRFTAPKGATALLAPISEPGYHTLVLQEQRVTLAIAPSRAYTVADAWQAAHATGDERPASPGNRPHAHEAAGPLLWGLSAQLYSLRRSGDGGIGDYSALAALAVRSAQHGAQALAVSPTHAMFSALPQHFSPYSPSSRLWLNATHIDPSALFGRDAVLSALDTLHAREAWAQYETLALIDWPHAAALRLKVLHRLFERFEQHATAAQRTSFATFCQRGSQALDDHARFEALHAFHLAQGASGHWRDWDATLRDPRNTAVAAFATAHQPAVEFHRFLQWLAASGLDAAQRQAREAGMTPGLIADLAVGCDGAGSHAWACGEAMLAGISIGAPPDPMNQLGQSWGLTTFSPRAMCRQGFAGFIDLLRASFAHAGGVRIDHILGLRRLWLIPEGASAKEGAYLRYPLDDMLRLIALESWRHRAIVIGEDLGTVPAGFRERLSALGIAGIRTLWLERSDNGRDFLPPQSWTREAMATTTTHDLPTIAGWWSGRDIAWRAESGQLPAREDGQDAVAGAQAERAMERCALWTALREAGVIATGGAGSGRPAPDTPPPPGAAPVEAALAFVAATPSQLAMYPLEDLLGLIEQPNLPGTIDEHPNWRRRLATPVAALFDDPVLMARLAVATRGRK
ncbi:4-alpha-glucanotransferase [Paraburkholderia hayleyella]|uniref:4-alpha-glucanotransferase n=1 Tax=Paraburkholderia hayleyella TaxID=2152889 RepID=UPI001290CBF6|nr:4-alpha-glucanotransferase [Paraburkholderia hayleyella]